MAGLRLPSFMRPHTSARCLLQAMACGAVALGLMAAAVLYEVAYLERALEARRVHLTPEMAEDHPQRKGFNALHKRAEGLMKASLVAALVAMLLS